VISAFGVDHGEISKGWRVVKAPKGFRGPGGKRGKRATGAQIRTRGQDPNFVSRPQKIKRAAEKVTRADVSLAGIGESAGKGSKAVGGFLERHPGLTGTALVGGGGAAGYKYLKDKQPKKRP
jgi:hypothetical protein